MSTTTPIALTDFSRDEYGIHQVSPDSLLNYGRALLIIAGADGEVAPEEMRWLLHHQRKFGVPPEIIAQYETYDFRHADLAEVFRTVRVDHDTWQGARHLLYHALQMASADGVLHDAERAKVIEAAHQLGLTDDITHGLIALVELERSATALRQSLLGLPRPTAP
ncbi:TerB family tellurite resistance protein [Streptomyces sp. NPDC057638]|uniref:TerB family tellurite resistance protein n=1 Tax=Streptomyces sp. NPDC057638 TaxID=3346190 RepID=UPI00368BC149